MLKLWGRVNSINVQKVRWAIGELGLPCERHDAGLEHGVVNEPWYREMNPNGRVPTIQDDGLTLWESNAIVRYLSCRYGSGSLWPADLKTRADADRWMDWTSSTLHPLVTPVFWGLIRTPPGQRNMKEIGESARKVNETLAIVERALTGRPYIAGEQLTMGDIPLGPFVNRWYRMPVERDPLPHVEAYFARLQTRAAFRDNVMIPLT
jgi:glutathione S-transferase